MENRDQLYNLRKMALVKSNQKGRIITITSGKGGIGKTNIALNLSIALSQLGKSVTLFDGDTHLANMNLLLGVTPRYTISDVIFNNKDISDIIFEGPSGIKVVCASSGVNELVGLENKLKDRFFQEFNRLRQKNDFMIIDTSAGLSETVIDFALNADEVVVITTPEPTAVSDAYAMVKILFGMKEKTYFKTLVNLVNSKDEAEEVFERFFLVINHFLKADTEYLGFVVEDKHVRSAVRDQSPFLISFPDSKASECIMKIAQRIIE